MKEGLDSLEELEKAQENIQSKAKEHAADQTKLFSGMGELGTATSGVLKNIIQIGVRSEETSKAVESAFGRIDGVFKASKEAPKVRRE